LEYGGTTVKKLRLPKSQFFIKNYFKLKIIGKRSY
jgi:hypothetical protein